MATTYHGGRALAILCGVAATGGALAILLADPYTTGNWRLDHVLLPIIVAITIAAGHLCGTAARSWRVLPAGGFALIFVIGTLLTVYSSVGAQKSGAGARQEADARQHNERIAEKRAELQRARERFDQANAMADREMTGERCARRCNDWKLRAREVEAHIHQLDAELVALGTVRVAPSKAKPFAAAMGVLGANAAKVEIIAATFEPFAYSLLFEMTAIVAFGYGFAGARVREQRVAAPVAAALTFERNEPLTPAEIEELRRLLIGAGRPLNNGEIAAALGVSKGESSKRVSEAVALGLVRKERVGREVAVTVH